MAAKRNWFAAVGYPRLTITLLSFYIIAFGSVGFFHYQSERQSLVKNAENHLESLAVAHARRLDGLVEGVSPLVSLVSSRTKLSRLVAELNVQHDDEKAAVLQRTLQGAFDAIKGGNLVQQYTILDRDRQIITKAGWPNKPVPAAWRTKILNEESGHSIVPLRTFISHKKDRYFVILSPIKYQEEVVGYIESVNFSPPFARSRDGLGETGEYFVIATDSDGKHFYLTDTRASDDDILQDVNEPELLAMIRSFADNSNSVHLTRMNDRAGQEVLTVVAATSDFQWTVVARQRLDELYAGFVREQLFLWAQLFFVGLAAVFLTTFWFARKIGVLARQVDDFIAATPQFQPQKKAGFATELDYLSAMTGEIIQHVEQSRDRLRLMLRENALESRQTFQELRTLDEALVQSAKLAALGEVAMGIAHEINQPIGAIQLKLERLKDQYADANDVELVSELDEMARYLWRLSKLTQNLREMSHMSDEQFERVDIGKVIQSVLTLIGPQLENANISIEVDLPEAPVSIIASMDWLEQIVLNLLTNARDSLNEQSQSDALKEIAICVKESDQTILIQISDNGPGISAAVAEKLFDPFVTSKGKGHGAGLGLAIVKRLVERLSGSISLDKDYTQGARFQICFPKGTAYSE